MDKTIFIKRGTLIGVSAAAAVIAILFLKAVWQSIAVWTPAVDGTMRKKTASIKSSVPESCLENSENLENWGPEVRRVLALTTQTTATVQARLMGLAFLVISVFFSTAILSNKWEKGLLVGLNSVFALLQVIAPTST